MILVFIYNGWLEYLLPEQDVFMQYDQIKFIFQ